MNCADCSIILAKAISCLSRRLFLRVCDQIGAQSRGYPASRALRPSLLFPCQLLCLAINHFAGNQRIFKMRIAVDKATPLLLPLLRRWFSSLGSVKKFFQSVSHPYNIADSGCRRHPTFAQAAGNFEAKVNKHEPTSCDLEL